MNDLALSRLRRHVEDPIYDHWFALKHQHSFHHTKLGLTFLSPSRKGGHQVSSQGSNHFSGMRTPTLSPLCLCLFLILLIWLQNKLLSHSVAFELIFKKQQHFEVTLTHISQECRDTPHPHFPLPSLCHLQSECIFGNRIPFSQKRFPQSVQRQSGRMVQGAGFGLRPPEPGSQLPHKLCDL